LWCARVFLGTCGVGNLGERVDIDTTALRISISDRENLDALARIVPTGGNMPDKLRKRQRTCIIHSICEHDDGLDMPGGKGLQLLILLINGVEQERIATGGDAVNLVQHLLTLGANRRHGGENLRLRAKLGQAEVIEITQQADKLGQSLARTHNLVVPPTGSFILPE